MTHFSHLHPSNVPCCKQVSVLVKDVCIFHSDPQYISECFRETSNLVCNRAL